MTGKEDAIEIFNAAIKAVHPALLLASNLIVRDDALYISDQILPWTSFNQIFVIGAGKAAASMAIETEKILGSHLSAGVVITKYGHSLPAKKIRIMEGGHPISDENCVQAVSETVHLLQKVTPNDIVICLLSGGASSLWCDLPQGVSLLDLQMTVRLLINSGATIHEVNCVRKHLSSIKGGQLINYCNGARIFSLILSDVPGNDLDVIGSGPTIGDKSTFIEAYNIILKYGLLTVLSQRVINYLENGIKGRVTETPSPHQTLFFKTINRVIGDNSIALQAAENKAKNLGYNTYVNPKMITGDTELEAEKLILMLSKFAHKKPICILQGGETTIKVTSTGKGGRNQHFTLVALIKLMGEINKCIPIDITILSAGTDGTDGPTSAAGAIIDKSTIKRLLLVDLSPEEYLKNFDAYSFFKKTNNLFITGPTQTNVMDLMMAIVT
jgi:glycerate-2-kinase